MKSNIEEFPSQSNYEGTANKETPEKLNLEKSGIEENSNLPIYSVPSFLNEEPIEKEDLEDKKPSCDESLENVSIALNDFTNIFLSKFDALSTTIDRLVKNIKTIKSPSFKSSSSKQVDDLDEVSTNDDESDIVTPPSEEAEDSLGDKIEENTEEENTEEENTEKNKIVDKASQDKNISPQDISTVELIHKTITNINKDTDKKFKPHTSKLISLSKKKEYRVQRKTLTDNVALNIKELIHIKNKEIKDKESMGIFSIIFNNGSDIFFSLKKAFETISSSTTGKLALGGGALTLFGGSVKALISDEMKRRGYPAYFIDNLIGKGPKTNLYIGADEAKKEGEEDQKKNPSTSLITTKGGSAEVLKELSKERLSGDFSNKNITLGTGIQNDTDGFDEDSITTKVRDQISRLRELGVTDVKIMRLPNEWTKTVEGKTYTAEDVNKILEKVTTLNYSGEVSNEGFTVDKKISGAFEDMGVNVSLEPNKVPPKDDHTPSTLPISNPQSDLLKKADNTKAETVVANETYKDDDKIVIHTTENNIIQYIKDTVYDAISTFR